MIDPFLTEMIDSMRAALVGDAAAARRCAELCELFEMFGHAQAWWRAAARMGDPAAADYVRAILDA